MIRTRISRFKSAYQFLVRNCSQKSINPNYEVGRTVYQSLKGRDLLSFDGYTKNDIFSLLWIATELKLLQDQRPLGRSKRIGVIWSNPISKASLSHASQTLNSSLYAIHEDQLNSSNNYEMLGRSLGYTSDVIFLDTPSWNKSIIEEFATGCGCPVIVISSKQCSPGAVYAELLTLFEIYGFLRRLIIVYIGSGANSILNTYLTVLPTIGAHLRILVNEPIEDFSCWEKGVKIATKNSTEIQQFENFDDAIYRTHTISTSFKEYLLDKLRIRDISEMHLDWTFLQNDAIKGLNASKEFLSAKGHTLISDVINNQTWMLQALITGHTMDYTPVTEPPRFEGVD